MTTIPISAWRLLPVARYSMGVDYYLYSGVDTTEAQWMNLHRHLDGRDDFHLDWHRRFTGAWEQVRYAG